MTDGLVAPRAVLFDWDNTLVDSWAVIFEALNATFEEYGLRPWTFDEFSTNLGPSIRDSFPDLFGAEWEAAGEYFYQAFENEHLTRLTVLPGGEALVRELAGAGVYLGVVSNKTGRYLRAEVDHLGWRDLFGGVVGALDAVRDKPDAAPVIKALEGSGVAPGPEVWLVGDSRTDLVCAKAAGVPAILVRSAPPSDGEFADCPPIKHFSDLDKFRRWLRHLLVPNGKNKC